jgi:hypothetical protein
LISAILMTEGLVIPRRVILGSMRMHEIDRSLPQWVDFFLQAYGVGIRKLHSSNEYESYPLLCEVLKRLSECRPDVIFSHIVKLADPSFDESGFDADRLETRVRNYCTELGVTKINDVQWMWRSGLDDDSTRVANFKINKEKIMSAAEKMRATGLIERLLCFPYSRGFAEAAVAGGVFDGLVVYRNLNEMEYNGVIARAEQNQIVTLIIRPLHAGELLSDKVRSAKDIFDAALDMPGIESGIVSTSNIAHLRELLS